MQFALTVCHILSLISSPSSSQPGAFLAFVSQREDVDEGEDQEVVLNGWGAGVERTEEDGEAEDEFEALLSKTMSESVEKTKIARATTQVLFRWPLRGCYS